MLIPCSRSAHDPNVLARRPPWEQHGCHSCRDKRASEMDVARSMRRVKGSLAISLGEELARKYCGLIAG